MPAVDFAGVQWNSTQAFDPDSAFICVPTQWSSDDRPKCASGSQTKRVCTHLQAQLCCVSIDLW
jgi:hypothetical protein